MTHISLRPLQLPDDNSRIAELLNTIRQEPISAEKLEQEDRRILKEGRTSKNEDGLLIGYCRDRVVATNEQGQIMGYATVWRIPLTPPGQMSSILVVDPVFQKQGAGEALLQHMERWTREQGATLLVSELPDHLPAARTFVEKRGYEIERHMFQSVLDLASFAEASFAAKVESAEAQGFRFLTLAEGRKAYGEEAVYQVFHRTAQDIPGAPMIPTFEEWQEMTQAFPDDYVYLAVFQEQLVGITQLVQNEHTGGLYNEFTGVDSAYRGRGLALALKLLAIRAGQRAGAPYMRTDNDSTNAPMLAINEKLGYRPAPGHYRVRKEIPLS